MRIRSHSSLPSAPETDLTPLCPPAAAPFPDAQRAQGKSDLVVNHDQIARRVGIELFHQRLNRDAAQVHVRLRLGQNHFSAGDAGRGRQRPAAAVATATPPCSASRSMARKPALCGVNWYSMPGFPRPTTRAGPFRSLRPPSSPSSEPGYFFAPFSAAGSGAPSCPSWPLRVPPESQQPPHRPPAPPLP